MSHIGVSFDDSSLICTNTSNNVVNRSTNDLSFKAINSCSKVGLVLENSSHKPNSGISLLGEHADQILAEILCLSSVHIQGKRSVSYSSQREDAAGNGINAEDLLRAVVVLNIDHKFGEKFPHLEVEIPTVQDLALIVAEDDAGASFEGGELIHKVEEEDLVEGQATQLGNCTHFGHEILMLELILSKPFNSIEEPLGDWQQIEELQESGKRLLVVSDDWSPSNLRTV